jgi:hypothetical protein
MRNSDITLFPPIEAFDEFIPLFVITSPPAESRDDATPGYPLPQTTRMILLSLRSITFKHQGKLDHKRPYNAPFSLWLWFTPDDHIPLHCARFPERQLRELVRMSIETRIPDAQQVLVVRLPLDRVL